MLGGIKLENKLVLACVTTAGQGEDSMELALNFGQGNQQIF